MNLLFDVARVYLLERRRQTIVSLLGVAVGVGFSIAMAALLEGSNRDFIAKIIDYAPHVLVQDEFRDPPRQPVEREYAVAGAVEIEGLKPRDEPRGIRRARMILEAVTRMPGLDVAPSLRGQVILGYGSKEVSSSIVGIEPERERRVSKVEADMVAGTFDDLYTASNGLIVGQGLLRKLGAGLGDTVTATSPAGVVLNMKIVGVFRTGVTALDEAETYALLKKVQVLEDRPNVINRLRVRLDDVDAARAVAARIESRFGYRTESWQEANEGILSVFVIRNTIMYTTVAAILLVASFGIFNVVSTVTLEKTRDIAILKSLGFTEPDIRRMFLIQGAVLGSSGALIGCLLGYGLSRALGAVPIEVDALVAMERLPIHYTPVHYLVAGSVAVAAASVAAWLPARRAARLNPVDIIRGAA